jgi:release factor glutamine methyltransferase
VPLICLVTHAPGTDLAAVREALASASDALRAAGVDAPRLDAELLLCETTGWDRPRLAANPDIAVPVGAARRFAEAVRRRLRREPVAYILGRKGFRHIELAVDRRVLIPRPETELLVELALELQPRRVLDVGTGSGAIALAIADELPECEVVATDTSPPALEVARANAERLGLFDRIELVQATLPPPAPVEGESPTPGEPTFDLIVANLPYVAENEWAGLEPEVTQWEPREALLAGPDGLDAIRTLLSEHVRLLSLIGVQKTNALGGLALEVGDGQADAVADLMRRVGFEAVETRADLAGIPRVVWGHQ